VPSTSSPNGADDLTTSALSSIVIPVHNRAAITRQCLESIFADRPGVPFEIVVVDDCSTDSTPELLADYGKEIRVVRRDASGGFAPACNDGAAKAKGTYLVFLNNDTVPQPGWLDELVHYAEQRSEAGVVGSKLLYPDGTIQHAGVIISQEGYPRHLYAGFPGDHPAVNKSRPFVAVTFACALVRRNLFRKVGGLETAFRNSFEDVDFCFRLAELGHESHYCHKSVVYHLESVSRGRRAEDDRYNAKLLRDKWAHRLQPNDFEYYFQDGLLKVRYPETYPLQWQISPRLALHSGPGSVDEVRRLLDERSREVFKLLKETVRLTAHIAELELGRAEPPRPEPAEPVAPAKSDGLPSPVELFASVREIETDIYKLQYQLESLLKQRGDSVNGEHFTRSGDLGRQERLQRIRELIRSTVPDEGPILVVSGGDPDLVKLNDIEARHFPQGDRATHIVADPNGGSATIEHLEEMRGKGATFLVFPVTGLWWLDRYPEFRQYLEEHYEAVVNEDDACLIFAL
jgi:GT2 family glycosyltransferase